MTECIICKQDRNCVPLEVETYSCNECGVPSPKDVIVNICSECYNAVSALTVPVLKHQGKWHRGEWLERQGVDK